MITHERPRHEVAFAANRFKGLRTRMRAVRIYKGPLPKNDPASSSSGVTDTRR